MSSYSIIVKKRSETERSYAAAKNSVGNVSSDLDIIFSVALNKPSLFPPINMPEENNEAYLIRWIKEYQNAVGNPPSSRVASPKSYFSDPAIKNIVKNARNMSDEEVNIGIKNHNLFMSAENAQGNLLEEYIASEIRQYGFVWCRGNSLKAIDFCNTDGSLLLQIKNKSNSENSSSNKIRIGTTIKKWFRLGTATVNGKKEPVFKWDSLNKIIDDNKTEGHSLNTCSMSEEKYQDFIINVASANTNIISDS